MKKSSALNAWTDINSLLRTHKLINAGLLGLALIQAGVIGMMYFSDPIVVIQSGGSQEFLSGKRSEVVISEEAVKDFVEDFLKRRYEWDALDPESKSKTLAPIVTKGLGKKLFSLLTHLKDQEFQRKETQQVIVNVKVDVTEQSVVASFDKILRIEGIPIPVPTTISLNIIKGATNAWNPIGLYVNGIREHQSK